MLCLLVFGMQLGDKATSQCLFCSSYVRVFVNKRYPAHTLFHPPKLLIQIVRALWRVHMILCILKQGWPAGGF